MFDWLFKDVYSYIKHEIFLVRNLIYDTDSRIDKLLKRISHLETREVGYWEKRFETDKELAKQELLDEYGFTLFQDVPFPILKIIRKMYPGIKGTANIPLGKMIKEYKERGKNNE